MNGTEARRREESRASDRTGVCGYFRLFMCWAVRIHYTCTTRLTKPGEDGGVVASGLGCAVLC